MQQVAINMCTTMSYIPTNTVLVIFVLEQARALLSLVDIVSHQKSPVLQELVLIL